MIKLKKTLLLLFLFALGLNLSLKSQNSTQDSLQIKIETTLGQDILLAPIVIEKFDTIAMQDTIELFKPDSSIGNNSLNTVHLIDSANEISFEEYMMELEDSLIFEKPDSIHYIIYNLNKLIKDNASLLSDTTKQAVRKVIRYYQSRDVEAATNYLKENFKKSVYLEQNSDSLKIQLTDSINNAIRYLLNNINKDSLNLVFTNSISDSIFLKSATNEMDSIRIRLADNRGEYAILWIKKSEDSVFSIFLEDGIYINKVEQQEIVTQKLAREIKRPKLRKVNKVDMIIPIWKFDGLADVKYNQGYVSESWAEGGENSMSALSVFKYSADYTYGKKRNLDTDVEYKLGYLKTGTNSLKKNDDRFEINAKYGKSAFNNWYYGFLLNFKTQFLKGYDYSKDTAIEISNILSPAYLIFSMGLDYKPNKSLTILLSPLTSKFTIVADTVRYDQTRFGVGQDEKIRKEVGAYIKAIYKIKIKDNIFIENKINFFTNYTKNPQNIDVEWEADITIKLTDYIKMSVNGHLIYDDDVEIPVKENGKQIGVTKNIQFKEIFGIGFTYSF